MLGHKENVHLINGQWMDDFSTVSYCLCMQHYLGTNNLYKHLCRYIDIWKGEIKLKANNSKKQIKNSMLHLKMHYNVLIVLLLD